MSEMSNESVGALESALGAAFSDAPAEAPAPKVQARQPAAIEAEPPLIESDPADLLEGFEDEQPVETPPEVAEAEFEIDLDGKPEVIRGNDRVKELLARGLKAGRGFEENARMREALAAQANQAQLQAQFQQVVSPDIAHVHALEQQLQAYQKVDWSAEYDRDPFNAMKLKEQRDQLREQRAAAIQNLNAKQQHFTQQFQANSQRVLAAENEALLAKVPAWRNPEKASLEKGEITSALTSHYGFTQGEIGMTDHRMLMVARDAVAYRKLLANKDARLKQAREAPATARPGAVAQPNSRADFNKVRGKIKELGTKGNHRAQEELATRLFEKAFK